MSIIATFLCVVAIFALANGSGQVRSKYYFKFSKKTTGFTSHSAVSHQILPYPITFCCFLSHFAVSHHILCLTQFLDYTLCNNTRCTYIISCCTALPNPFAQRIIQLSTEFFARKPLIRGDGREKRMGMEYTNSKARLL